MTARSGQSSVAPKMTPPATPYVLSLKQTDGGRFTVYRSEWVEFPGPGEWCRTNSRCVSGVFCSRDRTRDFAMRYVAEHPGHTRDPGKDGR